MTEFFDLAARTALSKNDNNPSNVVSLMENRTLLIVVALLLAGLVVIFLARDISNNNVDNSKNTFEHSELGK